MSPERHRRVTLATGGFVTLDGERYYRIAAYDRLPPFMMSIPSDSDIWLFLTSGGGLTAGRVSADQSLFPYETVDKLHDAHHHTGPITLVRARTDGGKELLWEPFGDRAIATFDVSRNLYKNLEGNRAVFEEINHDLGLTFRYRWTACDEFGLVRTATLANSGSRAVSLSVLDGFRNVLPWGVSLARQQQASSLIDAYKHTDLDPESGMGIFSLTATIVDRAEASECLRANVVWSCGLEGVDTLLSLDAVDTFRQGTRIAAETPLTGRRGNYFLRASLELPPGGSRRWHLVADVGCGQVQIESLRRRILREDELENALARSLDEARDNLNRNVAGADGTQLTEDTTVSAHHFANVLFNNLRGGVFAFEQRVPRDDLRAFLATRNRTTALRHAAFVDALPEMLPVRDLIDAARNSGDPDLERLCLEYLPIHFGRRHGDPSRPWNRFVIKVRNADGSRALAYEGNWRDIFQNWEALSSSYPHFLPNIVARFVNASTADGFNPYRVTRDGLDWEVIDPEDSWSYIGYWGDHQIIYLLKFLEALVRYTPGALETMLEREVFSYANVPYRLAPYARILEDPHRTISFDSDLAAVIDERVSSMGSDGKLLLDASGSIVHVNLLEKLLVPMLSKLSNFVPGGGIWMNTQRPEWNDANNALVGRGVSMVTLCYLRRYLAFMIDVLRRAEPETAVLSSEVAAWMREVHGALEGGLPAVREDRVGGTERRQLMDTLGEAFSHYRSHVYAHGLRGREEVPAASLVSLCRVALEHLDHTVRQNRRDDDLFNAYGILDARPESYEATTRPLQEQLEGQVAALSSGTLAPEEAIRLLDGLFESRLYRESANSFMLYPDRALPRFLDRNRIPEDRVLAVPLLRKLLDAGESSILARDVRGTCRFHADFRNADDLGQALDRLGKRDAWGGLVARDRASVFEVFEAVFHHRAFTGRSGTMYAFEGLGSIYWHMVAKLLLAVQEVLFRAERDRASTRVRDELQAHYYRVRSGLGFEKTVSEYGAFPTDPYSHSPSHAGAQQPGMTGQVKEEILTRFGELGIRVENGILSFHPTLLRPSEFLRAPGVLRVPNSGGGMRLLTIPAGALAFTFCGVPVIYHATREESWMRVIDADNAGEIREGLSLDRDESETVFARQGGINRIEVGIPIGMLCRIGEPQGRAGRITVSAPPSA